MDEIELARTYLQSLLEVERAPQAELVAYQRDLLAPLYKHAIQNAPLYKYYPKLAAAPDPASQAWRDLPLVSRRDLTGRANSIAASAMPPAHGVIARVQTGGSTGIPAHVSLSSLESVARIASSYRMFLAWEMDVARPLFMIRRPRAGSERHDTAGFRRWGFPWLPESTLGPRLHMDIVTPPADQLAAIAKQAPAYVNTLPSNILRLGLDARAHLDRPPDIPIIISVAEHLPPEVRALAKETFGSRVINVLSSVEGGVIAIECPASGLLHIQSEAVVVEIIKDNGEPCQVGEVGELVVTPLYNYATPLIRYRSGDFAETGPPCPCGRSLPTIARVVGRREHMFLFPDGRRELPDIDRARISQILGHDLWLFVQSGPAAAELLIAADGYESHASELKAFLTVATDKMFSIGLRRVDALPLTSGGKRHFCVNQTVLNQTV
jgi:phenylacetate-CoA ligase